MKFLHTSDWHLGASLHGRKRFDEIQMFFSWLIHTINDEHIDLLLVSGDIFDTSTPGSRAQEMYYQFLGNIAKTCCKSVIIVAGNHDSPSLISAPKEILRFLDIHVIGNITSNIEDQIIPVCDNDGNTVLLVCAVPFLREKDILTATVRDTEESRMNLLTQGIITYYSAIGNLAEQRRGEINPAIPIIATGHLFAAGCHTRTGDGIRECYVGDSVHVGADAFPSCFSYVALGHLHVPQIVAHNNTIRYSGSPIPISFSEVDQGKTVIMIEIKELDNLIIKDLSVPLFQRLLSLKGKKEDIEEEILKLRMDGSKIWIEVIVDSIEPPSILQNWISELTKDTGIEYLKIFNSRLGTISLQPGTEGESLENVSERDVFQRRLDEEKLSDEERAELTEAFEEILLEYQQNDSMDR